MKQERNIASILSSFQKYELEDIGNLFGTHFPSRMKKSEMVAGLAYYLSACPSKWLNHLMERDLRLLKMLVEAGPDVQLNLDYPPYPTVLEAAGLVDFDDSDGSFHRVLLRQEVYDIVAPFIDDAIAEGEKTGYFDIERVALGYLNLYGVLEFELFIDLMMEYYEQNFGSDFGPLTEYFKSSPLLKLCRCNDDGKMGDCVCSPCVENPGELFSNRSFYSGIDNYRQFAWTEAMKAGSDAPFFTYGLDTPEGEAMTDMLRSLGYDGSELLIEVHDIWMNSQLLNDDIADSVFDTVTQCGDKIGSLDRYNECLHIIADYVNSLPKWLLKGYSPEESGYLKVVLKFDPSVENDPACGEAPRWSMPRPTISDGYTDLIETDAALERLSAMMPEGFPFGMAIPHVAPDDPCPCGSGLKYRNCHGRRLN